MFYNTSENNIREIVMYQLTKVCSQDSGIHCFSNNFCLFFVVPFDIKWRITSVILSGGDKPMNKYLGEDIYATENDERDEDISSSRNYKGDRCLLSCIINIIE